MKKIALKYKVLAFVMILAFTFQSLHSINNHTYTTGLSNFHTENFIKMSCFVGIDLNAELPHFIKDCGEAFHLE